MILQNFAKSPLAVFTLSMTEESHQSVPFPLLYNALEQFPHSSTDLTSVGSNGNMEIMTAWLEKNQQKLLQQLGEHGAILLRGFPVRTHLDFDRVVRAFNLKNFSYVDSLSNAVRQNRTDRVFTANEAPPTVEIYLHHEMAQTPIFPTRLFFFCEQAAQLDGQTPLCRSDLLLAEIERQLPEFIKKCEALGVRYTSTMPATDDFDSGQGRSWRSTLSAQTKDQAEAKLRKLAYQWQWLDQDSLQITTAILPAVRLLNDGRRVFFNQLIAAYRGWQDKRNNPRKSISFGDGSEISEIDMAQVISLAQGLTFDLAWQSGDVAMVDNYLVMHGRRPYQGTRKVLASLCG